MKTIERVCQIKNGKTWETTYTETDPGSVYAALSRDLIAKKINECKYIRSIKRTPNYDGTCTIAVLYSTGDVRSIYTVQE